MSSLVLNKRAFATSPSRWCLIVLNVTQPVFHLVKKSGAEREEGFKATLVQKSLKSLRQPLKGLYLRLLNEHAGSSNVCRGLTLKD